MGKVTGMIIIMIIAIITIIILVNNVNSKAYYLELPKPDEVTSIILERKNGQTDDATKEITDKEMIQKVIQTLKGNNRKTKTESIQDAPVGDNITRKIRVDMKKVDGTVKTIFAYQKKSHSYLEQPYNGVYKISTDTFNEIIAYLY